MKWSYGHPFDVDTPPPCLPTLTLCRCRTLTLTIASLPLCSSPNVLAMRIQSPANLSCKSSSFFSFYLQRWFHNISLFLMWNLARFAHRNEAVRVPKCPNMWPKIRFNVIWSQSAAVSVNEPRVPMLYGFLHTISFHQWGGGVLCFLTGICYIVPFHVLQPKKNF